MKNPFRPGDVQHTTIVVTESMLARFADVPGGGLIHPVLSTFAVAHEAEWCCRQFVLAMLEPGEQGVGSYVSVEHVAPAPLGARVTFTATLLAVEGNRIRCRYAAHAEGAEGPRLIAKGEQEQRILDAARFAQTIARLKG